MDIVAEDLDCGLHDVDDLLEKLVVAETGVY